mmetsp:Transcript_43651/g.78540  ORF Transcript_43651/g.78540 Transcript_43651/m.78540 type:complete len:82 (+) Transcript_43651:249-494(+)
MLPCLFSEFGWFRYLFEGRFQHNFELETPQTRDGDRRMQSTGGITTSFTTWRPGFRFHTNCFAFLCVCSHLKKTRSWLNAV